VPADQKRASTNHFWHLADDLTVVIVTTRKAHVTWDGINALTVKAALLDVALADLPTVCISELYVVVGTGTRGKL